MANLRDRLVSKSEGLIQRETITLPKSGEVIVVRSLMSGEMFNINASKEQYRQAITIALGTEDPETGQPIFRSNDVHDLEAVGKLHWRDIKAISDAINRLSDTDEADAEGNEDGATMTESSHSSLSDTESAGEPSTN